MKGREKAQNNEESGSPAARPKKVSLLLVDESREDLAYFSAILQRQGYEVQPLSSYREAAARIERETFDLIIMRQGESNFAGRSVLARTVERHRDLPVLVLSQRLDSAASRAGTNPAAADNGEYPLPPSEVVEQVAAYLRLGSRAA